MDESSLWLSNLSDMFRNNLDFDECYDDSEKYYLLFTLEYILAKWDPDIQYFSDQWSAYSNKVTYPEDSKQHRVIISSS